MEKTSQGALLMANPAGKYAHLHQTSWCSMPWTHQFVDPEGRVKPCCRFKMSERRERESSLKVKTLQEIFTDPFMSQIRSDMKSGKKIDGCLRCYQEEASGKKSLRQRYNRRNSLPPHELISDLNSPKIRWIELGLSNDCNLACRMCDSRYSLKWFDDEKEFYGKTFSKTKRAKWDIEAITPFLDDLVHIKFTGGEPLMARGHVSFIDKLLDRGLAKNIFLNYNTNLTIRPGKSLIEKWKKFRYVEIACSFDGVGAVWELVRYPSRWEKAEKVLRLFFQLTHEMDCRIGLRSAISVNNILGMADSFDWWIENWNQYAAAPFEKNQWINPTHVTFPSFLSLTALPEKYKDIIAGKLRRQSLRFSGKMRESINAQINYMMSGGDSALLPQLRDYTLHFDKKRGQNFFKANPELEGLFDDL